MRVVKEIEINNNQITENKPKAFVNGDYERKLLNVYPIRRSKILGFGGAFTETSAYNYSMLSEENKHKALEELFGKTGLNYNFCRLCISSCDFALDEYCYTKGEDYELQTFSIDRDKKYIIPFVKDAIEYSENDIFLFASPWAPPAFMKTTDSRFQGGKLKKDCYKLYANYFVKFLQAYKDEGVIIQGITIQNEPNAVQTWESCCFTTEDEIEFSKVLRPTLNDNGFDYVKIFCWDHNKERLFEKADDILSSIPDIIDGMAYHWYTGEHFEAVSLVKEKYPDKYVIESEFCISVAEDKVNTTYKKEILNGIKHGANAICEWNMITDENGGPYHNRICGCDAPLKFDSKTNTCEKSGIYYQMLPFSKYIERDAWSLATSSYTGDIELTAIQNPDGKRVIIINNYGDCKNNCHVYMDKQFYPINLQKNSTYVLVVA